MATDHGVAARFYLLVIVLCRSGIFLPWLLSSTLTNAAIWPGGLWNGAAFKFLETLGKAKGRLAALFKRTHEVTNGQTFAKSGHASSRCLPGPKGASFAPACRVPLAQWLERWSYEP